MATLVHFAVLLDQLSSITKCAGGKPAQVVGPVTRVAVADERDEPRWLTDLSIRPLPRHSLQVAA